jgi:hypothetical protein
MQVRFPACEKLNVFFPRFDSQDVGKIEQDLTVARSYPQAAKMGTPYFREQAIDFFIHDRLRTAIVDGPGDRLCQALSIEGFE